MRKICAVISIVFIILVLFCGCGRNEKEHEERFVEEYFQADGTRYLMIMRDTETGYAYLFFKKGYGCGVTRLYEDNAEHYGVTVEELQKEDSA